MKSFFLLTVMSFFIASASLASNYHLNEDKIEALFVSSQDITDTYQSIMHGSYDLNQDQSVSESEKSQVTAAIIAFVATIAGSAIVGVTYQVAAILTGGISVFFCWPILLAPLIPWHRLYLGTGGSNFKIGGLYCVTLSWCGWLNIIDGVMLLVDDTGSKYIGSSKYLMWANQN